MRADILAALNTASGRPLVRALDRATGEERLIDPSTDQSPLGLAAAAAARADSSTESEIGGRVWFLEVHNPPLDLVLVGAVHIAQALAPMAVLAGYGVRVIDPRAAFATTARFPGCDVVCAWPDENLISDSLGTRSAVVVLAHDPKIDDPGLAAALKSPCFYVGALGSRKSHAARLERLRNMGFLDADMARIHGPVGLAIGARSPGEIAISILAQMTETLRL
jgi:xanthine dehydrogenase accessory factor